MKTVNFDKEKLARFKIAYEIAVESNVDVFVFEGQEYLVSFAKYLIEYLTLKLK